MALGDPVLNEVALLADLPAGGNKITNLAAGALAGDSLRFDELGVANGIAQLDASALVPEAQVPHTLANLLTLNGGAQLGADLDANGKDITNFHYITAITTGTSRIECSFDQVMWIQGASTVRLEIRGGGATAPAGSFTFYTPNLGGTKTERFAIKGNTDVVDVVWSAVLQSGLKLKDALDANAMKITGLAAPTADGEAVSLGDAVLSGSEAKVVADVNVIGGIPLVHRIAVAGGANADTDVTLTHKERVIDAWMVLKAGGTGGSKITVKNVANAISDAVDISAGADKAIFRIAEIDDAQHEITAGNVLRVSHESTGGDCPAVEVYVLCIRVA